MKFVTDGMLGELTRWLRMLGYDVGYSRDLGDRELIAAASKERRAILTRDLALYQQATAKGINSLYLEGETIESKLAEVADRYRIRLDIDMTISRCPKCNTKVRSITKEKATEKVEKNTLVHYDEFWECPKCKQTYWQGAHWTRIRRTLQMAKEDLERLGTKR